MIVTYVLGTHSLQVRKENEVEEADLEHHPSSYRYQRRTRTNYYRVPQITEAMEQYQKVRCQRIQ